MACQDINARIVAKLLVNKNIHLVIKTEWLSVKMLVNFLRVKPIEEGLVPIKDEAPDSDSP